MFRLLLHSLVVIALWSGASFADEHKSEQLIAAETKLQQFKDNHSEQVTRVNQRIKSTDKEILAEKRRLNTYKRNLISHQTGETFFEFLDHTFRGDRRTTFLENKIAESEKKLKQLESNKSEYKKSITTLENTKTRMTVILERNVTKADPEKLKVETASRQQAALDAVTAYHTARAQVEIGKKVFDNRIAMFEKLIDESRRLGLDKAVEAFTGQIKLLREGHKVWLDRQWNYMFGRKREMERIFEENKEHGIGPRYYSDLHNYYKRKAHEEGKDVREFEMDYIDDGSLVRTVKSVTRYANGVISGRNTNHHSIFDEFTTESVGGFLLDYGNEYEVSPAGAWKFFKRYWGSYVFGVLRSGVDAIKDLFIIVLEFGDTLGELTENALRSYGVDTNLLGDENLRTAGKVKDALVNASGDDVEKVVTGGISSLKRKVESTAGKGQKGIDEATGAVGYGVAAISGAPEKFAVEGLKKFGKVATGLTKVDELADGVKAGDAAPKGPKTGADQPSGSGGDATPKVDPETPAPDASKSSASEAGAKAETPKTGERTLPDSDAPTVDSKQPGTQVESQDVPGSEVASAPDAAAGTPGKPATGSAKADAPAGGTAAEKVAIPGNQPTGGTPPTGAGTTAPQPVEVPPNTPTGGTTGQPSTVDGAGLPDSKADTVTGGQTGNAGRPLTEAGSTAPQPVEVPPNTPTGGSTGQPSTVDGAGLPDSKADTVTGGQTGSGTPGTTPESMDLPGTTSKSGTPGTTPESMDLPGSKTPGTTPESMDVPGSATGSARPDSKAGTVGGPGGAQPEIDLEFDSNPDPRPASQPGPDKRGEVDGAKAQPEVSRPKTGATPEPLVLDNPPVVKDGSIEVGFDGVERKVFVREGIITLEDGTKAVLSHTPQGASNRVGKGSFSDVFEATTPDGRPIIGPDGKPLLIKVTKSADDGLDALGYEALAKVDPDAVDVPTVYSTHKLGEKRSNLDYNQGEISVVERSPDSYDKSWQDSAGQRKRSDIDGELLRPTDGKMSRGQAIAFDKAMRALNDKGYVWLDNKADNYSFVHLGGDNWKLVIIDPGGIVPIKGRNPKIARELQRAIDDPPLRGTGTFEALRAQIHRWLADKFDKHIDWKEINDKTGGRFDPDTGTRSPYRTLDPNKRGGLHYAPVNGFRFPKTGELARAKTPAEVAAAQAKMRGEQPSRAGAKAPDADKPAKGPETGDSGGKSKAAKGAKDPAVAKDPGGKKLPLTKRLPDEELAGDIPPTVDPVKPKPGPDAAKGDAGGGRVKTGSGDKKPDGPDPETPASGAKAKEKDKPDADDKGKDEMSKAHQPIRLPDEEEKKQKPITGSANQGSGSGSGSVSSGGSGGSGGSSGQVTGAGAGGQGSGGAGTPTERNGGGSGSGSSSGLGSGGGQTPPNDTEATESEIEYVVGGGQVIKVIPSISFTIEPYEEEEIIIIGSWIDGTSNLIGMNPYDYRDIKKRPVTGGGSKPEVVIGSPPPKPVEKKPPVSETKPPKSETKPPETSGSGTPKGKVSIRCGGWRHAVGYSFQGMGGLISYVEYGSLDDMRNGSATVNFKGSGYNKTVQARIGADLKFYAESKIYSYGRYTGTVTGLKSAAGTAVTPVGQTSTQINVTSGDKACK